jgi:hypothetical protein
MERTKAWLEPCRTSLHRDDLPIPEYLRVWRGLRPSKNTLRSVTQPHDILDLLPCVIPHRSNRGEPSLLFVNFCATTFRHFFDAGIDRGQKSPVRQMAFI